MENKFFIKQLAKDLPLPQYMTDSSAGMDLYAAINEDVILKRGEIALVETGIAISIPKGFEAQIRPRSGLALNHGITLLNSPGTVDADYRGEIKVILINCSKEDFLIKRGLRIAQMVICKVYTPEFVLTEVLDETKRGDGGFGHTGL